MSDPSFASGRISLSPRIGGILAGCAVLFGFFLRFHGLGKESLWFDEGYSFAIARLPVSKIIEAVRLDTAPPLYYLLLNGWMKLFGDSESALRSLSAVFGCAALGVVYRLAKRIVIDPLGVAGVMALSATSFLLLYHSQEARFYGLLAFLGLLAFDLLLGLLNRPTWGRSLGFVLVLTLGLYTHNMMAFYAVMLVLAGLITPSGLSPGKRLVLLAGVFGMVGVLYFPWSVVVLQQMWAMQGDFWMDRPDWAHRQYVLRMLGTVGGVDAYGVAKFVGLSLARSVWINLCTCGLVLAGVFTAIRLVMRQRSSAINPADSHTSPAHAQTRLALATLVYALGPIAMVWVYSLIKQPIFIDRGLVISSGLIPLVMLLPIGLCRHGNWNRSFVLFPAILLLGLNLISVRRYSFAGERKEPYRDAVQYVLDHQQQGDLLLFVSHLNEVLYDYYRNRAAPVSIKPDAVGLPNRWQENDPPRLISKLAVTRPLEPLEKAISTGRYRHVVFLRIHSDGSDPRIIPAWLDTHANLVDQKTFRVISVERYEIHPVH